jgi:hypothetical protein
MRPYIWTFVGPCPGASKARMVERGDMTTLSCRLSRARQKAAAGRPFSGLQTNCQPFDWTTCGTKVAVEVTGMSNHHLRSAVSAPRPLPGESDVILPRAEAHAVLFVVDHEDTRDMYAMVLEASGYRVLMAESGAAALAHARNQTVSAVITDVCMPGTVTGPRSIGFSAVWAFRSWLYRIGSALGGRCGDNCARLRGACEEAGRSRALERHNGSPDRPSAD